MKRELFFLLLIVASHVSRIGAACGLDEFPVLAFNTYQFAHNILLKHDENNNSCIVFKQLDDFTKATISSSSIDEEKGLYISIDNGTTKNLHVQDSGDTSVSGFFTIQGGTLVLEANGNAISLVAPSALAGDYTLTFPGNDGTSGQLLSTNGSGTLSWVPAPSGVTIGTANGLSLAGQEISLGLSSGSTTGALSNTDWTTFNNKQTSTAALIALAAFNTNGLMTQTAANTFTGRTITGTSNQVIVTNGDGVSGNPTLALPQDIAITSSPTFVDVTLDGNLDVAGNVGIGQAPGSDALEVTGNIVATETLYYSDDANSGVLLRAAGTASANTRIEWGNINGSNGNVINSSGSVSCTRNSTGVYTITITPGLKVEPVIVVTPKGTAALASGVQAMTSTTSSNATSTVVVVRIFSGALLPLAIDSTFSFVAIGIQ